MAGYVDLYILPIPKKNIPAYCRMARKFGKIIHEHGALEYREFRGDHLQVKGMGVSLPSKVKLRPGEVMTFAVVGFRSRAHRDRVNKRAMSDPRMKQMMGCESLFDAKRMIYGGFSTMVKGW